MWPMRGGVTKFSQTVKVAGVNGFPMAFDPSTGAIWDI